MTPKNKSARGKAGVLVEVEQAETTNQNGQDQCSTTADVLRSKSTATDAQRRKTLTLLRQGPKTTIDLREHGIMMPATRVFELRNAEGHVIESELVNLYDSAGFLHRKCARYHLVKEATSEAKP
jgi:hypothetical protein